MRGSKGHKPKRLGLEQFNEAIKSLSIGEQAVSITRAVMVDGAKQLDQARVYGITRGAVSQAVNRVWLAAEQSKLNALPAGYEKLTVILPEHRAFIVKKWASEAEELLKVKV